MDINDLINPLRYVNLKNIEPSNILSIGEGVFPEPSTLDHLAVLDLVTKAYQAVHLPTLGNIPIPNSTELNSVILSDSKTQIVLVTAASNEVIEVVGLSVRVPDNYATGGAKLSIRYQNTDLPIIDLTNYDTMTQGISGLFYGNLIKSTNDNQQSCNRLFVSGGESLILDTAQTANANQTIQIVTRKYQQ
jgi:hypothetical protein